MSTRPKQTWRELVYSVSRYFRKSPTPEQIYARLAAKYPRMAQQLRQPSARSCVRAAMSSLRADGYILDEAQRAEMARHPKPWNLRNQRRRDRGLCISCPRPAVTVELPVGKNELRTYSLGRCAEHRRAHSEACARRERELKVN